MRADYYFIVAFAHTDCLSFEDIVTMISTDNDDYAIARAKEVFRLYGGSRRVEVFTAGRLLAALDAEPKTGVRDPLADYVEIDVGSVRNGGDNETD